MFVAVVTPPDPVLEWDEIKTALRIDSDDEQAMVEGLAAAALSWIGGPGGWLGRAVGEQTLEARFDAFPCRTIDLPCGPVRTDEAIDIVYLDAGGEEQTLDPSTYTILSDGRLVLAVDQSWPVTQSVEEAVRVTYVAGEAEVPQAIKQAMLLLIGHWHLNRETVNIGNIVNTVPFGVEALLSNFRRYW